MFFGGLVVRRPCPRNSCVLLESLCLWNIWRYDVSSNSVCDADPFECLSCIHTPQNIRTLQNTSTLYVCTSQKLRFVPTLLRTCVSLSFDISIHTKWPIIVYMPLHLLPFLHRLRSGIGGEFGLGRCTMVANRCLGGGKGVCPSASSFLLSEIVLLHAWVLIYDLM